MLEGARRQNTFEEIQGGLDETNALFEARRCLSCGNCFECDNCYGVCPDNAVIKLCLLYTSDAADDLLCVDLGGRRIIKKKKKKKNKKKKKKIKKKKYKKNNNKIKN